MLVESNAGIDEAGAKLDLVSAAQEKFATFTQQQVDEIFCSVARTMINHALELAEMAVEETGMGQVEDKFTKNHYAAEYIYNSYKDLRTVGVIRHAVGEGIDEIASPVGPIAAICPTTNPTSTVIAKSLMALKSGNAILHLPHPRAKKCSCKAAELVLQAAVAAGAPDGVVQIISHVSLDVTQYVLKHPKCRFILATGGDAMVRSAYSSGKPCLGVGAGNAPVLVDESADLRQAAASIVLGKTFDNGTICASEQSTVVVKEAYDEMKQLLTKRGVHFLEGADADKLRAVLLRKGGVNPEVVGKPAKSIAQLAGVSVPDNTVVLGAEAERIGDDEPLSHEKLSPILTMYKAEDFGEAMDKSLQLLRHGGMGHTAVFYTNERANGERVRQFELAMPACHLIVNMPSSAGAIGLAYNFNINPSLTLGVGSMAGSSASSNVTPLMLLNVKKLAAVREHIEWVKLPHVYFNKYCTREALNDLILPPEGSGQPRRALLVTDNTTVELGFVEEIRMWLKELKIESNVFQDVEPQPSLETVMAGVRACERFKPDLIVALGGGSPLDAAKVIRVLYEHPNKSFQELASGFMELRHRTTKFPDVSAKIRKLVAIPTTSGTGSEVTPYAAIMQEGTLRQLCSYQLTPDLAVVDARYTDPLTSHLVALGGFASFVHAVEAAISVWASDFTMPLAMRAIRLLFQHLEVAYKTGDEVAKEKVHHAATIAGMAFANAFLGLNQAMAHALSAEFNLPHGLACAVVFDVIVRYNSDPAPTRMTAFPQYKYPQSQERYAEMARHIGVPGTDEVTLVEAFIGKAKDLRETLGLPCTIKDAGISRADFDAKVEKLARAAFTDQCVGTNPRFPLIQELKQLFRFAYDGSQPTLHEVPSGSCRSAGP